MLSIVAALLAFSLANEAGRWTGFIPDESRWISRAHYLADVVDPFNPTWADQYMTRGQPPLGSYTMGAGLIVHGRDLETNPPWDFSVPWEENMAIGNAPLPADLAAGRRTSALLIALTTVALIAVTRVFASAPWALAAGTFFALHPFTSYIGSIAMSDALFGFLIALSALAAASLARRPCWQRAALLGVLLGLGGATKLSPLLLALALAVGALLTAIISGIRRRRVTPRERRFASHGMIVALAALATFVAVYPYLWPDPAGRTRNLFAFRAEEMATQAADWPEMAVPNRAEALRRVGTNFTERFSLAASASARLGGGIAPMPIRQVEVAIALIGVLAMLLAALTDGPYSPRFAALAVLGGHVLITILGMRSEFDRYHVPMALLGAVAAGVALQTMVTYLRNALAPRIATRQGESLCGS